MLTDVHQKYLRSGSIEELLIVINLNRRRFKAILSFFFVWSSLNLDVVLVYIIEASFVHCTLQLRLGYVSENE